MKINILIVSLILFTNISWAEDKVTIAYFQAEPHIFYNSSTKEVSGALYTFLNKHIAPQMGVEFTWDKSLSNVPRQIFMLSNESIDAVALLLFRPDRAEKYSYTKNKFYAPQPVIGVLRTNTLTKVDKVGDILHLKIGYSSGYYISPFMRDNRIDFSLVHSGMPNHQNLLKLRAGRIDAMYIPDKAALLSESKHLNMGDMLRVIDLPEKPGDMHVVFSKRNKALAMKYDKAFNEINGYKLYLELLSQYLDVDDLHTTNSIQAN